MNYRRLGRTGLNISAISFGSGQVGGLMINADNDTKLASVEQALDQGINWVDTAPQYGDGKSETAVGWALKELGRSPHVSTKFRLSKSDVATIDDTLGRSVERSLTRLGVDRLELLQLHNRIGMADGMLSPGVVVGAVYPALASLREQGLISHIGLTALGDTAACLAVMESGLFDTAQVYYNMINPSAGRRMPKNWTGQNFGGLLEAAARHDMGVLAIRIFAAGALATGGRTSVPSNITSDSEPSVEQLRARAVLSALPPDLQSDPAATAIRFGLACHRVSSVVVGLGESAHLQTALCAVGDGPLGQHTIDVLDGMYGSNFGEQRHPGARHQSN